jgi:hypothetical protein
MTAPKTPKTVTLSEPIEFEGREIAEVRIKKPKVKDLKRMNAELEGVTDQLQQGIVMAAALTGLPSQAIEELDTDDFTTISEAIADFFPQAKGRGSGAPSLQKQPIG